LVVLPATGGVDKTRGLQTAIVIRYELVLAFHYPFHLFQPHSDHLQSAALHNGRNVRQLTEARERTLRGSAAGHDGHGRDLPLRRSAAEHAGDLSLRADPAAEADRHRHPTVRADADSLCPAGRFSLRPAPSAASAAEDLDIRRRGGRRGDQHLRGRSACCTRHEQHLHLTSTFGERVHSRFVDWWGVGAIGCLLTVRVFQLQPLRPSSGTPSSSPVPPNSRQPPLGCSGHSEPGRHRAGCSGVRVQRVSGSG
jgi:hypothetical protein